MNRDEALRLRGRCSVWDCEEPIFAEALCSDHQLLAHNPPPKAPDPEPTFRSVHRAKRTGRLPLGRTTAGPPQSNPQQPQYSALQSDSSLAYSDKTLPTSSPTHQLSNHQGSNHMLGYPLLPVPKNPPMSRQKRTSAEDFEADASTITVQTIPPEPREPYFSLNPDIPSIDNYSSYARQRHYQNIPESKHVPSNIIPRRNLALVDELVDAGLEFASKVNLSLVQSSVLPSNSSSAIHKNPPAAISSAPVRDANLEESLSITVAKTPSWRKPDSVNPNKREASTIHVYQKPSPIFQIKENLPLHISPKKRKADASDTQPKIKDPSTKQRPEGRSVLLEQERQPGSRFSNQSEGGYQSAPLGKSSKYQSHRPSDGQTTSHLRNSKKIRTSNTLMPVIEVAITKAKGQIENHTHAQGGILDDGVGQKSAHTSQQPQQPKPRAKSPKDEQENMVGAPPPTLEKDVLGETQALLVATPIAEEHRKAKVHFFDSEAFDTMIYRQSMLRPPQGVSVQAPARPKTPVQRPSLEDQRRYLAINPAIHFPYNRSEEWYKEKALEIQARGGRKAWFGKVIERRRWLRAKEEAEEDERNAATVSTRKPTRIEPQPWSYNRIIDFGDVPQEKLPEDVLQNPAWVKACVWHRENQAKRVLRDRAARDANRKAWDQAERVMEDAKIALQRSRDPLKQ